MIYLKKILLSFCLFAISLLAYAQKGSVSGTLLDSANHKLTLNYATVSIYKGADTILTDYKLSNEKGVFKLSGLNIGQPYRLVVNAWMYNVLQKQVTLTAEKPDLNLGELYLSEKTNTLQEVVVKDVPPVLVRKDTIEFNAASFKTLPTAVVEDLLKKLPGVTIRDDGNIAVNGKAVSKILVDGKEFFGGDQQIATKNLPAHIIDKVQVVDDRDAKRRDPDLLASEVPQVINLKLKKAIKQGAFGKLYAGGGGPNERFETGGIMNFFRDTTQISMLAYGNNVNRPGFNINDVGRIGGMQRTGINSIMINSEGGFELNGIGFGGASSGIQKSSGAGANFNTMTKNGIKINTKYFFGHSDNSVTTASNIEQDLSGSKLFSTSNSNKNDISNSHNISAKADWKIDSLTSLSLEPSVVFTKLSSSNPQFSQSRNTNKQLLSDAQNNINSNTDILNFLVVGNYWKDFKKSGRSLNSSINVDRRNNSADLYNQSTTTFYNPNSNTVLDQLRDNSINNLNLFFSLNYTEPISKKLSLTLRNGSNYIDNENALATFLRNSATGDYDIVAPNFTQTVKQSGFKTNSSLGLRWNVSKSIQIRPGVVFNTIDLTNDFSTNPSFEQHFNFFAPTLNVRIKDFNLGYTPYFREPDVNYIQPVTNNTNPLFIQNGNPNLLPTKDHQFSINWYKYVTKSLVNYNLYVSSNIQKDGVIMAKTVTQSGVQITDPINVDGLFRLYGNGMVNKEFKKAKNQFAIGAGFNGSFNKNLIQINQIRSSALNINFGPTFNGRINLGDKVEFSERYSMTLNRNSYDDASFTDIKYFSHYSTSELVVRLPKKLVWETNYRIQYSTQTVAGFNNSIQIWNAGLTYLFMKNDRGQLKLGINDILNTNNRRQISIVQNTISDMITSNLGRHALLTFTYNIQNFGQKVGGTQSMFRF